MASLYLSNFGIESCIIEKKRFPREVLCGEFLSCEVVSSLKKLNLFNKFLALSPIEINAFRGFGDRGTGLFLPLKFPAYAIKRSVFDSFLLNEVKEFGANIYQPAEVQSIVKESNKFLLKVKGRDKSEYFIRSSFVIAAYGKQSIFDKKIDRNIRNRPSIFNAIKFHIPNELFFEYPQNDIRLYFGKDIYCGVNKVSSNETTLCFLEKRNEVKKSSRKRINDLMKENVSFGNLFKDGINEIISDLPIYGTTPPAGIERSSPTRPDTTTRPVGTERSTPTRPGTTTSPAGFRRSTATRPGSTTPPSAPGQAISRQQAATTSPSDPWPAIT